MLISLVVAIVLLALAYWAINQIAAAFGLPAQIVVLINVLLVVVAVLYILGLFGYGPGLPLR